MTEESKQRSPQQAEFEDNVRPYIQNVSVQSMAQLAQVLESIVPVRMVLLLDVMTPDRGVDTMHVTVIAGTPEEERATAMDMLARASGSIKAADARIVQMAEVPGSAADKGRGN